MAIALLALVVACREPATAPRPGPAATLAITAQPRSAIAGMRLNPAITVELRDSAGRVATDSRLAITLSLTGGSGTTGAHLRGATAAVSLNGVASFSSLSIDSTGTGYRLSASAAGCATVTSEAFDIAPGPSSRLVFATVPATAVVEEPIGAPLRVLVLDSIGNLATAASDAVTLGATGFLTGDTTQNAVGGVATFATVAFLDPGAFNLFATAPQVDGAVTDHSIAVRIVARSVSVGYWHTCVLTPRDAAYCWGDDTYGEIGDSAYVTSPNLTWQTRAPTRLRGLRFSSLHAGYLATCGVTPAGQAYCWGLNQPFSSAGQTMTSSPVAVQGGSALASVSVGEHACGLSAGGAAVCWGTNAQGQLGTGSVDAGSPTPVTVSGGLTFSAIRAAHWTTCGLDDHHNAYCWGESGWGSLGIGPGAGAVAVPTKVLGGFVWAAVDTWGETTCGVTTGGDALCWGDNASGQLGVGTADASTVPVRVNGGLKLAALSVGWFHVCAVTAGGAAYCWGFNDWGLLGDGTFADRAEPVAVQGGLSFTAIAAGWTHTCGIATGGAVYCWGSNLNGNITGNTSSFNFATTPVRVPGF